MDHGPANRGSIVSMKDDRHELSRRKTIIVGAILLIAGIVLSALTVALDAVLPSAGSGAWILFGAGVFVLGAVVLIVGLVSKRR